MSDYHREVMHLNYAGHGREYAAILTTTGDGVYLNIRDNPSASNPNQDYVSIMLFPETVTDLMTKLHAAYECAVKANERIAPRTSHDER